MDGDGKDNFEQTKNVLLERGLILNRALRLHARKTL
jgi:hypothetical protein